MKTYNLHTGRIEDSDDDKIKVYNVNTGSVKTLNESNKTLKRPASMFKAPTLTGGSASSIKKPVLNQPTMADFKKLDYAQSKDLKPAQNLAKSRGMFGTLGKTVPTPTLMTGTAKRAQDSRKEYENAMIFASPDEARQIRQNYEKQRQNQLNLITPMLTNQRAQRQILPQLPKDFKKQLSKDLSAQIPQREFGAATEEFMNDLNAQLEADMGLREQPVTRQSISQAEENLMALQRQSVPFAATSGFVKSMADLPAVMIPFTPEQRAQYNAPFAQTAELHPLAYGAGQFAGEAIKYGTAAKMVEGMPVLQEALGRFGGKVSSALGGKVSAEVISRLAAGRISDLPLDVIYAAQETDNPQDFAKNLGINTAMGLGTDVGLETIGKLWRMGKTAAASNAPGGENWYNRKMDELKDPFGVAPETKPGYNQGGGDLSGQRGSRSEGSVGNFGEGGLSQSSAVDTGRTRAGGQADGIDSEILRRKWELDTAETEIIRAGKTEYRIKKVPEAQISPIAKETQQILSEYGVPATISGEPVIARNGERFVQTGEGSTIGTGRVLIQNDHGFTPKNMGNHEALHASKFLYPDIHEAVETAITDGGIRVIKDGKINPVLQLIIDKYSKTHPNIDSISDQRELINEIAAQIAGLNAIDPDFTREKFGDILYDYDGALSAIQNALDEMKRRTGRSGAAGGNTRFTPLPEVKKPTLPPNDPMLQSLNWEKPEVDDSVFRLKKTLNEAGGLGGESISAKVPKRQAAQQVTEDTERIAQVLTQDLYRKPSVRESISNSYDFLNRKFVDAGHTIAKVGKITDDPSLYHFYNSAKQSRAQANYAIGGQGVIGSVGAQTDINGNPVGKSLYEIFEPIRKNGDEYHKQFSEYLFHRHNVDRMSIEARAAANPQFAGMLTEIKNKPVFGERVTAEVSLNAAAELEAAHPEFKQLAEDVYKYNQNLMQYRVDTGLLSREQADLMNALYPHYVPTHRYRAATSGAGATNSEVRINTGVKRAKGSNKDLMPIADQMAQQTVQTYAAGRRNLFGNRLLNDAEIHSDKLGGYIHSLSDGKKALDIDEFMDDMNGKFLVYRNGKPVEMEVNAGIFDGVKALAADTGEHNLFMSGVIGANNTFKKLVTGYNPMFIGRNFARDLQDAGLYSKDLTAFAKNYPKAWKEMATNGPLWQKYQALGGFGSSFFDYDKGYKMGTHLNQNRNAAQRFTIDTIENLNMMVEQAPRFAEFMSTVEKGGTSYENLMKAMYDAADVTVNFGRSGTWGKTINRTFVPFFNPSIQGASKMVRRFTETKGAKEWTELVIKAAALGVVPTLLNSLMYQDDKDYQMINQREKDTNYLFKLDNGLFVKIPKGRVLSLFGMGGDALMRAARGETVDWAGFINTAASQTLPTDPINNHILMQLYNAQLLNPDDPGKTWYGSPIEGMRLQNIQNPAMRYDEKTDRLSRWIGEKTGLSPKKINYVLDSYSGVLGDFALPLLTPQAERNPFMNAFTIDPQLSNNLSERFYNESDRITAARQAQEGNDFNDITSRYLSRQSGLVSDLYDQMRDIQSSTLPDGDKWAQIRPLREQLNALQQQTLDTLPYYEQAAQNAYIGPSDKEIAQAYFDANRELFGAEHALQVYDKDVYAKAKRLNEQGISYDLFADIYNRNKQIRAQYENYEGDDSRATMMATELSKYLDTLNLDPKKRAAVDDAFKFYNMNPADSKAYRFDMLSDDQKEKYAKYKEEKLDGTLWGGIRVSEQEFVKIVEITRGYKKKEEKKDALIAAGYSAIEANQIYNQLLK